jgi:hypothetical protein
VTQAVQCERFTSGAGLEHALLWFVWAVLLCAVLIVGRWMAAACQAVRDVRAAVVSRPTFSDEEVRAGKEGCCFTRLMAME